MVFCVREALLADLRSYQQTGVDIIFHQMMFRYFRKNG
jgi:hypothetical protein